MRKWPVLTLYDAGVRLIDCVHKTPAAQQSGYPYVGIPQMKEGWIDFGDARKISLADYLEWTKKAKPQKDDVLLSRRTNPGVTSVDKTNTEFALGQNLVLLRSDGRRVYPPFLKWLVRTPSWWEQIEKYLNVGAVFDSLRCADVPRFELPIPPLHVQERVSELMDALDDKFELNRRMDETLEAMARAIFRDWFVDFGPTRRQMAGATDPVQIMGGLTPDLEKAATVAPLFPATLADNGLPEGWAERAVGDDFHLVMGQSPPGSTYNENGDGLPFFQGRRDFSYRFPVERVYCSEPAREAEIDWTLISVRAPVGDINRAWSRCCIGRGVGAMLHRRNLFSFTYYTALELRRALAAYDGDGTVFGSINQKQLKSLASFGASTTAAIAFDELIKPLDDMIRNNTAECQTLTRLRDLLLPELMSGRLNVKDIKDTG